MPGHSYQSYLRFLAILRQAPVRRPFQLHLSLKHRDCDSVVLCCSAIYFQLLTFGLAGSALGFPRICSAEVSSSAAQLSFYIIRSLCSFVPCLTFIYFNSNLHISVLFIILNLQMGNKQ